MKDVIIIGGGVAGFGTAITLGSSKNKKSDGLDVLILDDGNSDLLKAKLYNVPFLSQGTTGKDALEKLKNDTLAFENNEFKEQKVVAINGEFGNFEVVTEGEKYKAKEVVIATGCHKLDIKLNGNEIPTIPHELIPKPGKIKVKYTKRNEIKEGLYVAGLLSGVTTMYATALGSGVEVACAILSKRAGRAAVIHDFEGSR